MLRNDSRYINSRNIAFETALIDRQVRNEFSQAVNWNNSRIRPFHMGGLYRLFNTTLVFGIMALLEPDPVRATEYQGFLEEFMEQHKDRTDLCSRRELQIIDLFLTKSRSPRTMVCKHQIHKRAPRAIIDERSPASANPDESITPSEQDTAQSMLNHLGGFGHSTQFNVPNMVLDSQSSMQDARFPYGPMPLSFDINRLDLWRVNSFVGSGESADPMLSASPATASTMHYDNSRVTPAVGDVPIGPFSQVSNTTELGVGLPSEVLQQSVAGPSPSSGNQTPDLLLTPWTGLIDAIVMPQD